MMRTIFVFIVFVFLLVPLTSHLLGIFDDVVLEGETDPLPQIELTLSSLQQGSFQRSFERWFKRNSGVWGYLVRTSGQINLSAFHQIGDGYQEKVVLGNDRHLIEKAYLRAANGFGAARRERLAQRVDEIAEVQRKLAERGIAFLFLISTNKPALYPETIPKRFRVADRGDRANSYQRILPLLQNSSINVFDTHEFFREIQEDYPFQFFARTGTHWNDFASCLVVQEILRRIGKHFPSPLVELQCTPYSFRETPSYPDRDLVRIINIWNPEYFYHRSPLPLNNRLTPDDVFRPRMLFVGTSFMHSLLRLFEQHRIHDEASFLYYFRRWESFPSGSARALDKTSFPWKNELLGSDVVIVEINHAFVHKAGYGFFKQALRWLDESG